MTNYKYIRLLFSLFMIFILYHAVVWIFFTKQIFNLEDNYYVGDLGRTSYQLNLLHPRKLEFTLSKQHYNQTNWNGEKIDLITIGDSFSHSGAGGFNPAYQDYLATNLNLNVLNIDGKPFETIISLFNNGSLETLKPKAIIIEYVERYVLFAFARDFDFSNIYKDISLKDIASSTPRNPYIPELLFINTANYKLPYYMLMYKILSQPQKALVKFNLTTELFTISQKTMLIDNADIKNINLVNTRNIQKINENLNKLALILKSLNIKLYFMPAVDKYDLYSDYIIDNRYNKNMFFDEMRNMKKDYYFVDTKKILSKLLKDGVKDVYYVDDTHWSYKASEAISKDTIFNATLNTK